MTIGSLNNDAHYLVTFHGALCWWRMTYVRCRPTVLPTPSTRDSTDSDSDENEWCEQDKMPVTKEDNSSPSLLRAANAESGDASSTL
jgi:hypothetical protein